MDKEQAIHKLRRQIVTGFHKPNSLMLEETLMNDFEIGRTPLREILNRLVFEGLVTSIPRRGYRVSAIDLHLIMNAIEVRKALFRLLAELLHERVTEQDIEQLQHFHSSSTYENLESAIEIDCDFHEMLNSFSGNTVLMDCLRIQRNVIVRLFINNHYNRICRFIQKDHEKIINTLKKKNGAELRECLFAHAQDFLNLTINRIQ